MRRGVTRAGLGNNPRPRELLRQRSHDRLREWSAKGTAALSNREQLSGRLDRDPWRVSVLFLWSCDLFRIELRQGKVRRISIPRTPLNRDGSRRLVHSPTTAGVSSSTAGISSSSTEVSSAEESFSV